MRPFVFPGPMLGVSWEGWPAGVEGLLVEKELPGPRVQIRVEAGACTAIYAKPAKSVPWAPGIQHIITELLELGFDDCLVDGTLTGTAAALRSMRSSEVRVGDAGFCVVIKFVISDLIHLGGIRYVTTYAKEPVACYPVALRDRRAELEKYCRGADLVGTVVLAEQREVRAELELDEVITVWGCGGVTKHPLSIYSFDSGKAWRTRIPESM